VRYDAAGFQHHIAYRTFKRQETTSHCYRTFNRQERNIWRSSQPRRDVHFQSIWGNSAFSDTLPMPYFSLESESMEATQKVFLHSTAASKSPLHSFKFSSGYYTNTSLFASPDINIYFIPGTKQSLELPYRGLACAKQIPQPKAWFSVRIMMSLCLKATSSVS